MCLCSLIPCLYISGHIFSIWECVSATQDGREMWSRIERVEVSARAWFDQFPQTTPSARTRCPRCELARRVFVLMGISRETRFPVFVDSHEHIYVPEYYQYLIQGLKMLLKTFLKWLYPCQNHPDIPFISANWCTDLIEVWLISNQGCKSRYAFAIRCKFLPVLFCCWAIRSQSVCMLIQISRFLCVWTWLRDG